MISSKYLSEDEYPCVYVGADRLWNFPYGFTFLHFKENKWKWAHYIIWSGNFLLKPNLVVFTYCVQLYHKKLSTATAASFLRGAGNGRCAPEVPSSIQYIDCTSPLHTRSYVTHEDAASSLPDTAFQSSNTALFANTDTVHKTSRPSHHFLESHLAFTE